MSASLLSSIWHGYFYPVQLKSRLLKIKVTMHEEEYNGCRTELLAKEMKSIDINDNGSKVHIYYFNFCM